MQPTRKVLPKLFSKRWYQLKESRANLNEKISDCIGKILRATATREEGTGKRKPLEAYIHRPGHVKVLNRNVFFDYTPWYLVALYHSLLLLAFIRVKFYILEGPVAGEAVHLKVLSWIRIQCCVFEERNRPVHAIDSLFGKGLESFFTRPIIQIGYTCQPTPPKEDFDLERIAKINLSVWE